MPPHAAVRPRRRRRPGIATLEFVLVFPLLLALVAGIFLVGRASVARVSAATRARTAAWDRRPAADPGTVLGLLNPPIRSAAEGFVGLPVPPGPLFPTASLTARSQTTATGHTWDARDVPFAPRGQPMIPHTDELGKLLAGSLDGLNQLVGRLGGALDGGRGGKTNADLGGQADALRRQRDDLGRQLADVVKEIASLADLADPTRDQLRRLRELRDQRRRLQDAMRKLDGMLGGPLGGR